MEELAKNGRNRTGRSCRIAKASDANRRFKSLAGRPPCQLEQKQPNRRRKPASSCEKPRGRHCSEPQAGLGSVRNSSALACYPYASSGRKACQVFAGCIERALTNWNLNVRWPRMAHQAPFVSSSFLQHAPNSEDEAPAGRSAARQAGGPSDNLRHAIAAGFLVAAVNTQAKPHSLS